MSNLSKCINTYAIWMYHTQLISEISKTGGVITVEVDRLVKGLAWASSEDTHGIICETAKAGLHTYLYKASTLNDRYNSLAAICNSTPLFIPYNVVDEVECMRAACYHMTELFVISYREASDHKKKLCLQKLFEFPQEVDAAKRLLSITMRSYADVHNDVMDTSVVIVELANRMNLFTLQLLEAYVPQSVGANLTVSTEPALDFINNHVIDAKRNLVIHY